MELCHMKIPLVMCVQREKKLRNDALAVGGAMTI